jgi:LmbE family N-acetylglucosaminyl deacetylase
LRVLVTSVHPDDEALGCAGTIFKHRDQGDELYWLIVTQPYEPVWSPDVIRRKAEEVEEAADWYGMTRFWKLGLPTMKLDQVPQAELIGKISQIVHEVRPEILYTVHSGDVHTDHRAVFTALTSATKPFKMAQLGVRRLLSFETLSSTDAAPPLASLSFLPNVYQDITPYLEKKLRSMELFATESQDSLQPRGSSAIRALARFRGATIGVEYAEAFMLIRECN